MMGIALLVACLCETHFFVTLHVLFAADEINKYTTANKRQCVVKFFSVDAVPQLSQNEQV